MSLTFFLAERLAVVVYPSEAPGWGWLAAVVVVFGAVGVVRGVCDVISKGSFLRDKEAPYQTVGEGAASINARGAHALRGGDDWVGGGVGIRHVEGRG